MKNIICLFLLLSTLSSFANSQGCLSQLLGIYRHSLGIPEPEASNIDGLNLANSIYEPYFSHIHPMDLDSINRRTMQRLAPMIQKIKPAFVLVSPMLLI